MKLFAIISGESYDERNIMTLTTTKEKAEAIQKICRDNDIYTWLETYEVMEPEDFQIRWEYDGWKDELITCDYMDDEDFSDYAIGKIAYVYAPNAVQARTKAKNLIAKWRKENPEEYDKLCGDDE